MPLVAQLYPIAGGKLDRTAPTEPPAVLHQDIATGVQGSGNLEVSGPVQAMKKRIEQISA